MSEKIYFTKRGLNKLINEIDELTNRLKNLQAQTAHAADVGGNQYHDNASYEMLVVDIRGDNWRLNQAHKCLNKAVLVDPPTNIDRVRIGTRVKLLKDGKFVIWEIVGFGESNPNEMLIAYNTPIAALIMGKSVGDTVSGVIAGKMTDIEVVEISKGEE